eukprot:GHVR01173303.1.p1 GENE.GHVR01173303.1~~GHVR01173303.1.p1  ORF type:complete len:586 (+),score=118.17 GHVR01173303.1:97-1854(+)
MTEPHIEFFKEELNADSASQKLDNLHRVKYIAAALGPDKTVEYLLPLLDSLNSGQDDELMHALAGEYLTLSAFIGGEKKFHLLVPPLEALCTQEETVVRMEAVETLCALPTKCVNDSNAQTLVEDYIFPVCKRLASADWFTNKVSACGLLSVCYQYCKNDSKETLRRIFINMCNDDTPMVRRAAAAKMKSFFLDVEKSSLDELIPVFKSLSQDDTQDSVRVSALSGALVLAKRLDMDANRQHTLPFFSSAHDDPSWKVRLALTKGLDDLIVCMGVDVSQSYLLNPLQCLLKDPEGDVRASAVTVIGKRIGDLTVDVLATFLIPAIVPLASDPSSSVRAALATVIGPIAQKVGKDQANRSLIGIFLELLKDESHEVRLNVVCHAGFVFEVLVADPVVQQLVLTVQSLISDPQWRIRLSVVEQIPKLAKLFNSDSNTSHLELLFFEALHDCVYSVREASLCQIKVLAQILPDSWCGNKLPSELMRIAQEGPYAHRITVLNAIVAVASVVDMDVAEQKLLPIINIGLCDPVPNVRFAASKTVAALAHNSKEWRNLLHSNCLNTLTELSTDKDIDVSYFAMKACVQVGA